MANATLAVAAPGFDAILLIAVGAFILNLVPVIWVDRDAEQRGVAPSRSRQTPRPEPA